MKRKGCESIIHDHDRDLWVIVMGSMDVPDIDLGDFRYRRVIKIFSFVQENAFENVVW